MGTRLHFSTAFHPQNHGQSKRTIQALEDMLRSYVLQFRGSWDQQLHLVEFAYNNSYQASIGMSPYEALYNKQCRTPLCWSEMGDKWFIGRDVIRQTAADVQIIRDRLKAA